MGGNKLEYGRKGPGERPGTPTASETSVSRRSFCKLGLALLGAAAVSGLPGVGRAQEKNLQAEIQQLSVTQLDKTLSELAAESEAYQGGELLRTRENSWEYSNTVTAGGVTFLVTLKANGEKWLDVASEGSVRANVDLKDFADLVKRFSGKEMDRVKIIIEQGTFDNNGVQTPYVNAYVFPLGSAGELLSSLGNGQHVIYGCSYFDRRVLGDPTVLVEPNNVDTLARR